MRPGVIDGCLERLRCRLVGEVVYLDWWHIQLDPGDHDGRFADVVLIDVNEDAGGGVDPIGGFELVAVDDRQLRGKEWQKGAYRSLQLRGEVQTGSSAGTESRGTPLGNSLKVPGSLMISGPELAANT